MDRLGYKTKYLTVPLLDFFKKKAGFIGGYLQEFVFFPENLLMAVEVMLWGCWGLGGFAWHGMNVVAGLIYRGHGNEPLMQKAPLSWMVWRDTPIPRGIWGMTCFRYIWWGNQLDFLTLYCSLCGKCPAWVCSLNTFPFIIGLQLHCDNNSGWCSQSTGSCKYKNRGCKIMYSKGLHTLSPGNS